MREDIRVLTHSSIRLQDEYVVYIDPYDIKNEPHDADFVLFTHDHSDHFSPEDAARVMRSDTKIVAPEKMQAKAELVVPENGAFYSIQPNIVREVGKFIVEAVPAYNVLKPFHPRKAGWVGYIIKIRGKRVYIAGDTDLTDDIKHISCEIAMVPVGGTYTMDARKAAELVNLIHPETAIPTHYGSVVGSESDGETFRQLVESPVSVEIIKEY